MRFLKMPQISNNIVNSKPCPNYIFFFVFTEITSKNTKQPKIVPPNFISQIVVKTTKILRKSLKIKVKKWIFVVR